MPKLTKRYIESLLAKADDYFLWDEEISGFGVRVYKSGHKSYLVQYRSAGRTRRRSIGQHGVLTADEARREARTLLGEVARGGNPTDLNRARWPNDLLWELVCAEMNDDLCEMRSGCDPNPLKEVHKENHISMMVRQILGNAITLAALNGKTQKELPEFLQNTANVLSREVIKNPEKSRKQLQCAKDRYVFIDPQKRPSG